MKKQANETDALRRLGFGVWFAETYPDAKTARKTFGEATGLSKGRISQLFNDAEPFGEEAARKLEEFFGLDGGAFLEMGKSESSKKWSRRNALPPNGTGKTSITNDLVGVKSLTLAPLIYWGRLGEDLNKANDLVVGVEKLATPDGCTNKFKWVVVEQDYPAFRIKRGGKIAVEPIDDTTPALEGELHLFRLAGGSFTIGEYRLLAGGNYEALVSDGPPLERDRHGLSVVAVIVGTFR